MKAMCEKVRSVIKSASEKLTGRKRRAYQAEVTMKLFGGKCPQGGKGDGMGQRDGKKGSQRSGDRNRVFGQFSEPRKKKDRR